MDSIVKSPIIVVWDDYKESIANLLFRNKDQSLIFEDRIGERLVLLLFCLQKFCKGTF